MITQKRKEWLAEALALDSPLGLKIMLGPHLWFHFGTALSEVILPNEYYQVRPRGSERWDDLGLNACAQDWAKWPGDVSDDLAQQSRFTLFRAIGAPIYGARGGQAIQFAVNLMAAPDPAPSPPPVDPQLLLANRTSAAKLFPLAFLDTPFLGDAKKVLNGWGLRGLERRRLDGSVFDNQEGSYSFLDSLR